MRNPAQPPTSNNRINSNQGAANKL